MAQNQDFRVKKGLVVQSTATFISNVNAISTTTGAVQVTGGVGVGGSMYIGGNVNVAGTINASVTGVITSATNITNGTRGQIPYQTANGLTGFFGPGTAGQLLVSAGANAPVYQSTLTLAGTTQATSTGTGAFQVAGGAGIGGNLYVGGSAQIGTTYNNTATGSKFTFNAVLQTSTVYSVNNTQQNVVLAVPMKNWSIVTTDGNNIIPIISKDTNNNLSIGTSGSGFIGDVSIYAGDPSNNINFYTGLGSANRVYINSNGSLIIPQFTQVISTNTGALQVSGGAGFASNVFVGGVITATNVFVGPYPVSTGTSLGLSLNGTQLGNINAINLGTGTIATIFNSTGTIWVNTATLMQYAVNVANGGNGALVYNPAPNTTGFLSTGTPGQMLLAAVGAPIWTSTSSIYVQSSRYTDNVRGGVAGSVVYQSAANTTDVTAAGSAGQVFISRGTVSPVWQSTMTLAGTTAASSTQTGAFQVAGGAGVGGSLYVGADSKFVANTDATSTITGALQVIGGVGVGKSVYIGGNLGLGSNVVYPAAGTNGLSFNENYNPSTNNALQANYHFASGAGVNASVLSLSVTGQHTNAIGTTGDATSNKLVFASTGSNTSFEFRNNVGIQPVNLGSGSLLLGIATTGQVTIPTNISATSTQSGSLVIGGGLGIGGNLFVGGVLYATVEGSINTATNIKGGVAGSIPYQSAGGTTAFTAAGSTGQILLSGGTGSPTWASTSNVYVNSARYADNIVGGSAGALHYQTAANTTNFVALSGTQKSLLTAGAGAPTWVTQVQAQSGTGSASGASGQSLVVTGGGLGVTGDSYFANNLGVGGNETIAGTLQVNSTNANTGTNTSNALYTAGGAWIDKSLVVAGPTTFRDTVTFLGTATYIYSTNTVVTDAVVNLHSPGGATPDVHTWTLDDGQSIGHLYHYYKGADKDAFLGWNNASTYLEWWENGQAIGNAFTGTTWGTFRTGAIKLVGGAPNVGNTTSGDLTVLGGAGFNGNVWIQGSLNVQGGVNAVINGTITTATNLSGGTAGQLVYQSAAGATSFYGPGTAGQILTSNGTGGPLYTNTSTLLTGYAIDISGGGNGSILYQPTASDTQFLSTGTPGQLLSSAVGAPAWVNTSSLLVGYAINDTGGAAGSVRYQSAPNVSTFLSIGAAGTFMTSSGTAPVWSSTATALIGYSQNIAGGTAGQIHYQSAANTTAFVGPGTAGQLLVSQGATGPTFVGPGTAGQLLVSAGAASPVYTNTSSIYVNSAVYANELVGGTAGALVYQAGANDTAFLTVGASGYVLQSNGTTPVWSPLSGVSAGQATTATNLAFGTAGQVPYQTGGGATSFFGPGLAGQLLQSNGSSAPSYLSTSSVYVQNSVYTDKIRGGAAGSLVYQSAADTTALLGLGSTGYFLTAGATAPQWTNTATALIGYASNIAGGSAGQFHYQSSPNTTAFMSTSSMFVNSARYTDNVTGGGAGSLVYQSAANTTAMLAIGTNGFVLTSNGTSPVWQAISGLSAGNATTATNLAGGTAGQLPYQTAPGSTSFTGPGTAGQLLQSNGSTAPSYVNTTSVYTGRSIYSDSVYGGGNGAIHYQSAPNTTSFLSTGTPGQILTADVGAPAWATTSNVYVGNAVISDKIRGGTAGQLVYQSNITTTGFVGPGTAGQLLVSAGTSAPTYTNTSSISVGFGANLLGGAAGSLPYQTAANATGFLAIGTNGYVLTSNGSVPTWAAVSGLTAGNATNAANIATIQQTASGTYYPTFVNANNASSANMAVYTTSTFTINPATGAVGINGVGGTALNITVPSTITDRYFLNATAAVNSFSIYDNGNTPYINSYASMSVRVNQMGGSGGSFNVTGGNVYVGSNLGVGQASPTQKLEVAGAIKVAGTAVTAATLGTGGAVLDYTYPTTRMYIGDGTGWDFRIAKRAASATTDLFTFADTGGLAFNGSFGSSGQFLQSNGSSSPTWVTASGVGVGSATTASQVNVVAQPAAGTYYPTFVDSNNATGSGELIYSTSSFTVNPGTGAVGLGGDLNMANSTAIRHGTQWTLGSDGTTISMGSTAVGRNIGLYNNSATPSLYNPSGTTNIVVGGTSVSELFTVVGGSIRTASDNTGIIVGNDANLGFVKKSGFSAQLTTNNAIPIIFSKLNQATITGANIAAGTLTTLAQISLAGGFSVNTTADPGAGGIYATGEITAYYSDRRLKTNVKTIDNAVEKVLSLNGITYTPNDLAESFGFDKSKKVVGLFADEVEAVLPEATKAAPFDLDENGNSKSGENYKTVQYEKVVPLLVEAIKEQQKQIAQLTEMVKSLTNK